MEANLSESVGGNGIMRECYRKWCERNPEYHSRYQKNYREKNRNDAMNIEMGKVVRTWRKEHRMNQTQLGSLIGVGASQISAYETSAVVVPVYRFWDIPDLFRMLKEVERKWKN